MEQKIGCKSAKKWIRRPTPIQGPESNVGKGISVLIFQGGIIIWTRQYQGKLGPYRSSEQCSRPIRSTEINGQILPANLKEGIFII